MFRYIKQLFCDHLFKYYRDEVWYISNEYELIEVLKCERCAKQLYSWRQDG